MKGADIAFALGNPAVSVSSLTVADLVFKNTLARGRLDVWVAETYDAKSMEKIDRRDLSI
ncbi:MAG: hypothetical protein EOO46_15005 [Flavobacterium sp.]|nr:MAG: hypothetical protein EOO46_15005 [Flavobacterium sp.]